jgi:hypothetical protein
MSDPLSSDFVLAGVFALDEQVEATRLAIHLGYGHFSVSDAEKRPPKRQVILYPFLRDMLSGQFTEYIGDGVRYSFSGNQLGVYQYQFRGEGDFRPVKEWSLITTFSKTKSASVKIAGATNPDVIHFSNGKYGEGPTTEFQIEFTIPGDRMMEVLGMSELAFKHFLERNDRQLTER